MKQVVDGEDRTILHISIMFTRIPVVSYLLSLPNINLLKVDKVRPITLIAVSLELYFLFLRLEQ
jgi:ankyrin repeat protein